MNLSESIPEIKNVPQISLEMTRNIDGISKELQLDFHELFRFHQIHFMKVLVEDMTGILGTNNKTRGP